MCYMNSLNAPGPNAESIGHAAVGLAGGWILHEIAKPKTALGAIVMWLIGAGVTIWAHARFDLPVARIIATVAPAIG